jgi:hypothetical protein
VSELFSLPLKTEDVKNGIFTEHEMYLALLAIYTSFLKDTDSINSFGIRQLSYKAVHVLGDLVEEHVSEVADPGIVNSLLHSIFNNRKASTIGDLGKKAIKALVEDLNPKQVAWAHVLSTAAGVAATQGSLFANVIEYFANQPDDFKTSINKLAKSTAEGSFDQLKQYVLEAARLSCETAVYRTAAAATTIQDGKDHKITLNPGDKVLLNFRSACLDPVAFPKPTKFDATRPVAKYLHLGIGPHDNLGFETTVVALTAMCKVVLSLDKLAPAKGPQGKIHKVPRLLDVKRTTAADPEEIEGYHGFLTENWDQVWPVPQSKFFLML